MRIAFRVELGVTRHSVAEELRTARYQAGTEQITNPDRASAESEVRRAQRAYDSIDAEYRTKDAQCSSAGPKSAPCAEVPSIKTTRAQRQSDLDAAKQKVTNTPATVERPVWRETNYVVKHHAWSTPWSYALDDGQAPSRNSGAFASQDDESPGIAAAQIPADPLVSPTKDDLEKNLQRVLLDAATASFGTAFNAKVNRCITQPWTFDDAASLDCRVTAEFLAKGQPPEPAIWMQELPCEP
jgi:hypothetical protein